MSFDRLARHYRWMEAVLAGHRLQRARIAWLADVGTPCRALLAGEGNGRFLAAALGALPTTRFVCVDASAEMLEMARRAVPRRELGRVEFEHRALPGWVPERAGFDLVVTHFFLDCFPAEILERVVGSIAGALRRDACWLIADFALPARGPARWRARAILAVMYGFFRLVTRLPARSLVASEPMLLRRGCVRLAHREYEWGLIRSSLWRRL
jgi:SAM-dependent methyltransferase